MKEYVLEPNKHFDQFKIVLNDGNRFKFYHNNDESHDEFWPFLTHFKKEVVKACTEKCN